MLIGVGAVLDIAEHVAHSVASHASSAPYAPPTVVSVQVIAYALAVAAAIESWRPTRCLLDLHDVRSHRLQCTVDLRCDPA